MVISAGMGVAAESETRPVNPLLKFSWGDLPVILSAPHGGREPIPSVSERRGAGVPGFSVQRDNNTAELTHMISTKLGGEIGARPFAVVADFERKQVDANRPPQHAYESAGAQIHYDAYHQSLGAAAEEVRQRWGCGLLVDIHGQNAQQDTIFRGTDNLRSVSQLIARHGHQALTGPKSIAGYLHGRGVAVRPHVDGSERERRYSGGYITRTYGSHRGTRIDVLQLELGAGLRRRANLEKTANELAQAIAVFAKEYLPLEGSAGILCAGR